MRYRTLLTCLLPIAASACRSTSTAMRGAMPTAASPASAIALPPAGAVRHVVVFRFKPDAEPAKIDQLTAALGALKDSIPGVLAFEHGVNDSPEKLNQGYTHVYVFTFTSAAARDAYLVHPAHRAFAALVGRLGIWDGGFVVDYAPAP